VVQKALRWMRTLIHTLAWIALSLACAMFETAAAKDIPSRPVVTVQPSEDGFIATIDGETLRATVCGDTVVHILASPSNAAQGSSPLQPWMLDKSEACPGAKFDFAEGADDASLTTTKLRVTIKKEGGFLIFSTLDGSELLHEFETVPRTYEPVEFNGEKAFHVEDRFRPNMTEGLYGLGQHQNGMFNYRGGTIELGQNNTDVAIPLLVSSQGYAVLWNTASSTYVDNRFAPVLNFTSMAQNAVDYYFIYGPEMDQVIHQYRQMTGHAPMFPEWAYGFFQSKDSYRTQAELLEVAKHYRDEHIPLDCIVQDGVWWTARGDWFNSDYPDVPAALHELHAEHVHTMVSAWGLFADNALNLKKLQASGLEIPGTHVYDPTNPAGRDFLWNILGKPLLAQGWDSFWLDSSEPEEWYPHWGDAILQNKKLAIGSGAMYTNIFPLLHTAGFADHWKEITQEKRVLLLTRSAFLGEQRNGAMVWSGDVYPNNWALQHQIAAGLNFALSGMPYWTTDVAGYWPDYPGAKMTSPEYQELYARWFQFGAFCPIFRTHGRRPQNEIWTYNQVEPILLTYDKLRSRMMPYDYSLAWKVTHDDYTLQRPLVMDWRTDHKVWNIGDEYMFGPAFLVSPVWKEGARKRDVYLPAAAAWYDFWTGEKVPGGQDLEVEVPLEKLPLFVRAGSIVPLGPEIEYAGQEPGGPIEVRIYRGADGAFDLYEDEGDSYRYEQGAYAVVPIRWNEATETVTFGDRVGRFPGMVANRTFRIVLVDAGHGVGEAVSRDEQTDAVVEYSGKSVEHAFLSKEGQR